MQIIEFLILHHRVSTLQHDKWKSLIQRLKCTEDLGRIICCQLRKTDFIINMNKE